MQKDVYDQIVEKLQEYNEGLPERNIIDEFIDDEMILAMEPDADPDCC